MTTPSTTTHREWYPLVEALRAIAAVSVAAHHVKDLGGFGPFPGSWVLDGFGEWGVLLFFLLSGFLLCESFWGTRGRSDLAAFYVRRIARITPAYYVTTGLLFLFFASHSLLFSPYGARQTLANATFTHWFWPQYSSSLNVDGALWTLSIEMALYVSLPVLAWFVARWPVAATGSLVVLSVVWRGTVALWGQHFSSVWFGSATHVPEPIVRLYMSRQFPGFLGVFGLGILLRRGLLTHSRFLPDKFRSAVGSRGVLTLLGLLVPSVMVLRFTARSSDYHHWIWFSSYDLLVAALLIPPLAHAARHVASSGGFVLRVLQWLGQRSYSIYLWHFPVILTVFGRGPLSAAPERSHVALRILLVVVLTLIVAEVSYAAVEVRGIQVGKKGVERLRKRAAARQVAITVPTTTHDQLIGAADVPAPSP